MSSQAAAAASSRSSSSNAPEHALDNTPSAELKVSSNAAAWLADGHAKVASVHAADRGAAAASTSAVAPDPDSPTSQAAVAADTEAMDSVEVLYNECFGGFDYSDAMQDEMRRGTDGLSSSEEESLLRARHPIIGSDTQWKLSMACASNVSWRLDPLAVHLVREMGMAANDRHSQLAIDRVYFPATLPLDLLAHGLNVSEYDRREEVGFGRNAVVMRLLKTAYLDCEATSTLTLPELAKLYRQCEQVRVKGDLIAPKAKKSSDEDEQERENCQPAAARRTRKSVLFSKAINSNAALVKNAAARLSRLL